MEVEAMAVGMNVSCSGDVFGTLRKRTREC